MAGMVYTKKTGKKMVQAARKGSRNAQVIARPTGRTAWDRQDWAKIAVLRQKGVMIARIHVPRMQKLWIKLLHVTQAPAGSRYRSFKTM
jgi:hypothetical protein